MGEVTFEKCVGWFMAINCVWDNTNILIFLFGHYLTCNVTEIIT